MPPTEAQKIEYALITELHFECQWFIDAWNELHSLLSQGDRSVTSDPDAYNNSMWSFADRMLTHAARIDRILHPENWGSRDPPRSKSAREQFARTAASHLPADLFDQSDLKSLRGSVEHANERIPEFIVGRDINSLYPLLIGPLAVEDSKQSRSALRRFDPISKTCIVLGDRVELTRVHGSIRELKFKLPKRHVRMRVFQSEGTLVSGEWEAKHDREHPGAD